MTETNDSVLVYIASNTVAPTISNTSILKVGNSPVFVIDK